MNLVEGNNELNVAMTPIGVVVPQIVSASWEPKWISSPGGVQLIKGKVTISSPREFTGKVEVSLPNNRIAALEVLTEQQYQERLEIYRQQLAQCYISYPTPGRAQDVCVNYYGDALDYELGYRISVDGCRLFWDTRGTALAYIIRDIGTGVASKSWDVTFPVGQSDFNFAFLIKADEAVWNSEWWRITYYSGLYQLSPTVSLYEGANLLDSVVYENAIRFTIGEEWPVSVSVPAQIASGEDIQVSHTVHLAYGANYEYSIDLNLKPAYGRRSIGADYIGTNWYSKMQSFNPRADRYLLGGTGDYTFTGIFEGIGQSGPPSQRVPLPPGIYHLLSTCWLRSIASFVISPTGGSAATDYSWERQCWKDKDMGTVEII